MWVEPVENFNFDEIFHYILEKMAILEVFLYIKWLLGGFEGNQELEPQDGNEFYNLKSTRFIKNLIVVSKEAGIFSIPNLEYI